MLGCLYCWFPGLLTSVRIGSDLEGSSRGVVEVLSRYLSGETDGDHENFQVIRCPGRDSNPVFPNVHEEAMPPGDNFPRLPWLQFLRLWPGSQ
jgi:hypothetical protein